MEGFDITALGDPKPASRPLVLKIGKTVSDRSPELRKWKNAVRKAASGLELPEAVPLSCIIVFGMPVKDKKRWGRLHSFQPDFDNLAKAAVDAMQRDKKGPDQPIDNDGRIASSWIVKIYSERGFARIFMDPMPEYDLFEAKAAIDRAWDMPRGIRELAEIYRKK